ncbi:MAG: response regulator transcription factor [Actinomycetota bacterium]
MTPTRILIVEDEDSIAEPLADLLGREQFLVRRASSVEQGRSELAAEPPDLLLLDLMLPDGDGRDLLRELRATASTPVIVLTARDDPTDTVVGLELGADDYVVKPFRSTELIARIRAVLRRAKEAPRSADVLEIAGVRLDRGTRSVSRDGEPIELTRKEFDLLAMLMDHAGRIVPRGDLIDEVWDEHWFGSTKTLDVHVSTLRKKLSDDPADPRFLFTARSVGFRFVAPDAGDK